MWCRGPESNWRHRDFQFQTTPVASCRKPKNQPICPRLSDETLTTTTRNTRKRLASGTGLGHRPRQLAVRLVRTKGRTQAALFVSNSRWGRCAQETSAACGVAEQATARDDAPERPDALVVVGLLVRAFCAGAAPSCKVRNPEAQANGCTDRDSLTG